MSFIEDVVAGRTGPEGVRDALTSAAVRRHVRLALGRMLAEPATLGRCRLVRVKCKPGRKLTADYVAPVAGATAHVGVSWVPRGTGSPSPAAFLAVQEEARARGVAGPFSGLAQAVEGHGWMQVSPMDPGFPQLVRLTDPAYASEILGRPIVAVGTVRYRPGQRHVLRYEGEGVTTFAKAYRPGRVPPFGVAAEVADFLADRGDGFAAARPGSFVAGDRLVLSDQVEGRPLSFWLRRSPGPDVGGMVRRAGALLQALHEAPPSASDGLDVVDAATDVKATLRACEHIHHYLPAVGARVDAISARVLEILDGSPAEPPVLSHGDYKADHLLVGNGCLTVIDFDSCGRAEPARDIGKMLADLRWWGVRDAQDEFLAGYGPALSPGRLARARAYEDLSVVKMAARRVSMVKPDWAGRAARFVGTVDM